jgi:hypothetical protein
MRQINGVDATNSKKTHNKTIIIGRVGILGEER